MGQLGSFTTINYIIIW